MISKQDRYNKSIITFHFLKLISYLNKYLENFKALKYISKQVNLIVGKFH
jgi:hypothetical protein